MTGIPWLVAVVASLASAAAAQPPRVGDTWEVSVTRESSQQGDDGSSASSRGRDTLVERVVGLRADAVELEYDLPPDVPAEERSRQWQFPARILRPRDGPPILLNRTELEARVDAWLKAAKWTREACGRWIFTWNAFRIECDPQSVIETVAILAPRPADLREGALYSGDGASGPAPLARTGSGADGATWAARLEVDSEAVRRARAEADVVAGEITGEPVTLEAALRERSRLAVSGTISVTFDTDPAGGVRRRTRVTRLKISEPDGSTEIETSTETLERRLIARGGP